MPGKIGVIAPLTGNSMQSGITAKAGIELALQDFQLVYPDTSLEVVIEDSQSDPNQAAKIIEKFYAQGIRIVIAAGSSQEILAIKPFSDANGMIVISPTSTAPSLSLVDSIIRLSPNDLLHANGIAEFLRFRGIEAVVPIYRNDVFGNDFVKEFKARFEEKGGSVSDGVPYDTAAGDFSSYTGELATQVQAARQVRSASTVVVLTVSFGEILSIFTSSSKQPVLSTVNWYGTEDYACNEQLDNDPVARSFALSVQFTASIFSPCAYVHPYTTIISQKENLVTRAWKINPAISKPVLSLMYDSLWIASLIIRDPRLVNVQTFLDNLPVFLGTSGVSKLDKNGDRKVGFYGYFRYVDVENKPAWAMVGSYWPTKVIARPAVCYREFLPDGKDKLIRIGLLYPLTGGFASLAKGIVQMSEIAEEDINAFLQREYSPNSKVELVMADTQSDPDVALVKIKELKKQGINLVVGPLNSAELQKVLDYANQNEMILISPSSTAVSLAKDDNLFRKTLDDSVQAKALASLLIHEGYRNVEGLYCNDAYGSGLFALFSTAFTEMGGRCGAGVPYDPNTKQFDGIVKTLETQVSDSLKTFSSQQTAILMISFNEGVSVLETVASSQSFLANLRWYGCDGVAANKAFLESPAATEMAIRTGLTASIYGFGNNIEIFGVKSFLGNVTQRLGYTPMGYELAAYDSIWQYILLAENQDWQWNSPFPVLRSDFIALANNTISYRSFDTMNEFGDCVYGSIDFYKINAYSEKKAWDVYGFYLLDINNIESLVLYDQIGSSGAGEWSLYQ